MRSLYITPLGMWAPRVRAREHTPLAPPLAPWKLNLMAFSHATQTLFVAHHGAVYAGRGALKQAFFPDTVAAADSERDSLDASRWLGEQYVWPLVSGDINMLWCGRIVGVPGDVLVIVCDDNIVVGVDAANPLTIVFTYRLDDSPWSFDASPTLPIVAVGSNLHLVCVLDVLPERDGDAAAEAKHAVALRFSFPHAHNVPFVRFHPDGRRLATCSIDGLVRLYDAEGGRLLFAAVPSHEWCWSMCFVPLRELASEPPAGDADARDARLRPGAAEWQRTCAVPVSLEAVVRMRRCVLAQVVVGALPEKDVTHLAMRFRDEDDDAGAVGAHGDGDSGDDGDSWETDDGSSDAEGGDGDGDGDWRRDGDDAHDDEDSERGGSAPRGRADDAERARAVERRSSSDVDSGEGSGSAFLLPQPCADERVDDSGAASATADDMLGDAEYSDEFLEWGVSQAVPLFVDPAADQQRSCRSDAISLQFRRLYAGLSVEDTPPSCAEDECVLVVCTAHHVVVLDESLQFAGCLRHAVPRRRWSADALDRLSLCAPLPSLGEVLVCSQGSCAATVVHMQRVAPVVADCCGEQEACGSRPCGADVSSRVSVVLTPLAGLPAMEPTSVALVVAGLAVVPRDCDDDERHAADVLMLTLDGRVHAYAADAYPERAALHPLSLSW